MNHNQPFVPNQPYAPQRVQNVRIMLDRKMFYQQQMVALFGAARMGEVMGSQGCAWRAELGVGL